MVVQYVPVRIVKAIQSCSTHYSDLYRDKKKGNTIVVQLNRDSKSPEAFLPQTSKHRSMCNG